MFKLSAASHQGAIRRLHIQVSTETSQSLIIHKDAEGITASHQHINAQVKLESINYKWLWKNNKGKNVLIRKFQFIISEYSQYDA